MVHTMRAPTRVRATAHRWFARAHEEARIDAFIANLVDGVLRLVETLGYPGIVAAVAIESLVVPVPSEAIIPLGGFLTTSASAKLNLSGVILAATAGGMLGAWLIYGVCYWGREAVVLRLIRRWGRWAGISERDFDRASVAFSKRGEVIVLLGRMIPGLRSIVSIPAGLARMSFWKFTLYSALGTAVWSGALAFVGVAVGERWDAIQTSVIFDAGKVLVLVVVGALLAYVVVRAIRARRRARAVAIGDGQAPPSPAP